MSNDEARMTKQIRMTKSKQTPGAARFHFRISSLGILSSFVIRHSSFLVLLVCLFSASAAIPFRPTPAKGAESKTLLLYTESHSAYSLLDSLELLKFQLGRIATTVEPLPLSEFNAKKLEAADYVVILSPQPGPLLASNVAAAIRLARAPTLWVGFGVEDLQAPPV